jgi:hypothetical protein
MVGAVIKLVFEATFVSILHAYQERFDLPLVGVAHPDLLGKIQHGELDVVSAERCEVVGVMPFHALPSIALRISEISGFLGGTFENLPTFGIEAFNSASSIGRKIGFLQGVLPRFFVEVHEVPKFRTWSIG